MAPGVERTFRLQCLQFSVLYDERFRLTSKQKLLVGVWRGIGVYRSIGVWLGFGWINNRQ